MAKKKIRDLNRSARRDNRKIDRMVKSEERASKKRAKKAEKRKEADVARQEMISDTTPSKQFTRRKKRYDKKVEKKVEDYNNTNWVDSEGNPFEPKKKTKDSFPSYESKLEEKERKKATRRNKGRKLGEAISNRVSEEANKAVDNLTEKIDGAEEKNPVQEFTGNQVAEEKIKKSGSHEESKGGTDLSKNFEEETENIKNNVDKAQENIDGEIQSRRESRKGKKEIKSIAEKGQGEYTIPYSTEPTEEDLKRMQDEFRLKNALVKAGAPKLALEQLKVEDYYPPQQDFIQSSFVGRYIGSRQITSAVPARVPVGLYDARRRALKEKAKEKAKAMELMEKFLSYDTAEQFEVRYDDKVMQTVFKYLDLAGGDAEALLRGDSKLSQSFYKDVSYLENIGKSMLAVNGYADKIIQDAGSADFFVPKGVIAKAMEYKDGAKDIEPWLKKGPKSEEELQEYRDIFRSYESFTKLADARLKALKEMGPNAIPLKKGADYDAFMRGENTEFAQNAQNAIEENKSTDWSEYRKSVGKYWDIDAVEEIVRQMHIQNNLYNGEPGKEEEWIQDEVRYMLNHLSRQINLDQTFQQTKAYQWADLRRKKNNDRIKYDFYYQNLNEDMEAHSSEISRILNTYTGAEQTKKLNEYFAGPDVQFENTNLGGFYGYDIQGGFGDPVPYNADRASLRVEIGSSNLTLDEALANLQDLKNATPRSSNPLRGMGLTANTVNDYIDQISYQKTHTDQYMNANGEYYVPMVYDNGQIIPATHVEEVPAGKVLNGLYHTLSSTYRKQVLVDGKLVETDVPTTLRFGEFNLINNPTNQASLQSKRKDRSRESERYRDYGDDD